MVLKVQAMNQAQTVVQSQEQAQVETQGQGQGQGQPQAQAQAMGEGPELGISDVDTSDPEFLQQQMAALNRISEQADRAELDRSEPKKVDQYRSISST